MTATPTEIVDRPAEPPLLAQPAEPVGPVITAWPAVNQLIADLRSDTGPVALDTERASGFRYYNWAYLIQLKTAATGIHLIDPIALTDQPPADLSALGQALSSRLWILHAASQDLPCLAEVGLRPTTLFDTELAARLVNRPRVGLGPLVEDLLDLRLLKDHGASDWSIRPLPADWLNYAALDVELLEPLYLKLAAELDAQGKTEWADQEFRYWIDRTATPPAAREDPWRRTSGLHQIRSARALALVRELWLARDQVAQELDRAPGRVLNDRGITELAAPVRDRGPWPKSADLNRIEYFRRKPTASFRSVWLAALQRAQELPPTEWPRLRTGTDMPSSPRAWKRLNPEATARWAKLRPAIDHQAETVNLPPENLIQPDTLKHVAWRPAGTTADAIEQQLADSGARPWQRQLTVPVIVQALADQT
ncbi:MAG: HRDC domain-containing protein [Propionibacteriaceae bacterium]|jgi:ribonuclease D|nr:HRDC domain-containing protein [Propionibacteriaceae bacterium]